MSVRLEELLAQERAIIEGALTRLLPPADAWPARLHQAMRYAVLVGGKRLRPILVRAACRAVGGNQELALEPACALELIHTYSLIHDDLPALDNDTLRRGQATVHVAFGEALAILAGDALLTEGLAVLATYPPGDAFAPSRAEAVRLVARAIGSTGMVGGQVEDIEATGQPPSAERLERIHRTKTGALIAAAVELGAMLGGAEGELRRQLAELGLRLGLAFQIADDILDVTGTAECLGKSPGKDVAAGKLTYPAVHGLSAARAYLEELGEAVGAQARQLEGGSGVLAHLADYICRRDR